MTKKESARAKKPKTSAAQRKTAELKKLGKKILAGKKGDATIRPRPAKPTQAPQPTLSAAEAIQVALKELGPMKIDPGDAPKHLRELGGLLETVATEEAAYLRKKEAAATAKKTLDGVTKLLLTRLRTMTHPKPLPLFDAPQREADTQQMEAAAQKPSTLALVPDVNTSESPVQANRAS